MPKYEAMDIIPSTIERLRDELNDVKLDTRLSFSDPSLWTKRLHQYEAKIDILEEILKCKSNHAKV